MEIFLYELCKRNGAKEFMRDLINYKSVENYWAKSL